MLASRRPLSGLKDARVLAALPQLTSLRLREKFQQVVIDHALPQHRQVAGNLQHSSVEGHRLSPGNNCDNDKLNDTVNLTDNGKFYANDTL